MSKIKSGLIKKGKENPKKYKRRHDAFIVHVIVKPTDEKFTLKDAYYNMTVAQLKEELEFATGIPSSIQRLSYLDEEELQDHTDLRSNDFVPRCTVQLKVWNMYRDIIEAATANDIDWVFRIGTTNTSDFNTPASEYMTKKSRTTWLEERAFIALCLAVHRGHEELVVKLIENGQMQKKKNFQCNTRADQDHTLPPHDDPPGHTSYSDHDCADVNRQTSTGKTPLHLASAVGKGKMVDTLLHHGVDINAEDQNGNTALSVSERFGNKVCSRHLFQFAWQKRAKSIKPSQKVPLFAHQCCDSNFPVWKRGPSAQIYVTNILKPGEFEGTSLSSPRAKKHPSLVHKELRNATFFSESLSSFDSDFRSGLESLAPINERKSLTNLRKPLTYQEWLNRQKERVKNISQENKEHTDEDLKKKSVEEEMNKDENEDLGWEKWIKEIEQENIGKSQWHSSANKNISSGHDDNTKLPVNHDGALRAYLRSLGRSRSGVKFEDWLNEKEVEINQLVSEKNKNAPNYSQSNVTL